eukprot:m51a1_g4729 hypothetical protein (129) ;mRNA; r:344428-344906
MATHSLLCTLAALVALAALAPAVSPGCDTPQDRAAFVQHNATFHDDVEACGLKCKGSGPCTTECVKASVGLTDTCAGCFGADSQCARDKCIVQCMLDAKSAACLACHKEKCYPALLVCVEVPEEIIPQ